MEVTATMATAAAAQTAEAAGMAEAQEMAGEQIPAAGTLAAIRSEKVAMTPATNWNVREVADALYRSELTQTARRFGFMPALFGSVFYAGQGRDLDLLMVHIPHWGDGNAQKFLAAFGGVIQATYDRADRTTYSFEVERGGKLYHFVFQKEK
jgi:hypothetical protein